MNIIHGISNGLAGAFAMARGKSDWEAAMDMSPAAVFRSFWALPLALPGLILATEASRRMVIGLGKAPPPLGIILIESIISSLVVWALIVVFYIQLAKRVEAGWRISPLLIANNYATFLGYSLLGLGMGVASISGTDALFGFVWPMVMVLGIWLDWGMLRRGLALPAEGAIVAIIFVQFAAILISTVVGSVIAALFKVFGIVA